MSTQKIRGVWYRKFIGYKSVGFGRTKREAEADFAHKLRKELKSSLDGADAVRDKVARENNLRSHKQISETFFFLRIDGKWKAIKKGAD